MIIVESFVIAIGAVILGALFIWWEIRTAIDEAFWKGLIPMGMAVLVIGIAAALTLSTAAEQKVELLTTRLDNGMHAEMAVKVLNGDIIAYGPIEIFDEENVLQDRCSVSAYDLEDKEMENAGLPLYKEIFLNLTEGREVASTFSSDKEEILDESRLIFPDGNEQVMITYSAMWKSLAYLFIPMLAIYLMKRRQVRQEKLKRELKRISIESMI